SPHRPRTRGTRRASAIDLDATHGLMPGGTRREARALRELVLQPAHVRVLRGQLHLIGFAGDDRIDRLARLLERVLLRRAAQLGDRGEGARDLAGGVAARDVDGDAARLRIAEAWRLAAVVVLQRDDDVRVLWLAHDGD